MPAASAAAAPAAATAAAKTFKTVMSALKSNNERWGINTVELYFRKPTEAEVDLCQKALSQ
jgi:hypothetical protein